VENYMKEGISLIGVGLTGLYQLVVIIGPGYSALFGGIYPTWQLALLNCDTGDLIPALDMPVKFKPGWLFQGKRHIKDTDVVHAKASGYAVPPLVESTLGSALLPWDGSDGTLFYVSNGASSGNYRAYGAFGDTYVNSSNVRWHHYGAYKTGNALSDTKGTFSQKTTAGKTYLSWRMSNNSYEKEVDVVLTGNPLHFQRNTSDKAPNITHGSYMWRIRSKPSGAWSTSTSSTSSGMSLIALTKRVSLSEIPSQLVIDSIESSSKFSLAGMMIQMSELSKGNTEWRAIQFALDSYKYFNGETLEMMKDLYHIKQLLPPLKSFAKLASPKSWAQLFLWFKYGVLPSISDAKAVAEAFLKVTNCPMSMFLSNFTREMTRYGTNYDTSDSLNGHIVTKKCNARVTARPIATVENFCDKLFMVLKSLNIGITARNVWELIPYSFVVDWFVNTKQAVSFIDYQSQTCQYKLSNLVLSHKRTVEMPATDYLGGAKGFITVTTYQRSILSSFPPSTFQFDGSDPTSHWAEGTALVVSRLR